CRGCFPTGSGSLGLVQLCLTFRRPLERPQFVARCKAWRSALSPSPFRGNVYNVWGKVRFSDSEQLMEVSYSTIRGSLNVTPDQNQPLNLGPKDSSSSCFLVFDGLDLTEDGLKDLAQTLRQAAVVFPDAAPPCRHGRLYRRYVAEANREVELFNRQLELRGQPDLFDPLTGPLPPSVGFSCTGTARVWLTSRVVDRRKSPSLSLILRSVRRIKHLWPHVCSR
ncbi:hypothetical protein fugu_017165, partial [Takifugu bimaculatus]